MTDTTTAGIRRRLTQLEGRAARPGPAERVWLSRIRPNLADDADQERVDALLASSPAGTGGDAA